MMSNLLSVDFGSGATFRVGSTGPQVSVSGAQGGTECGQKGAVKRVACETALSYKFSGKKLEIEIVEVHWDRKITVDVPNDTVTHRARNYAGYYKNMPSGRHLKIELPLAKIVGPADANSTSAVDLQLKDSASLKWLHNPHRLYGPWGERERGPFEPAPASVMPPQSAQASTGLRLTFDTAVSAAAFSQSLAAERAPKPKPAAPASSSSGENGNPQVPPNPLLPLEGMSFVFTGNDGQACRSSREARVQRLGGKVTSAVSGKTSYLIAYDRSTKKYREASERKRDGKPGPCIVDEAGIDAVLDKAAATRKAAEAELHAPVSAAGTVAATAASSGVSTAATSTAAATTAAPIAPPGPSDEPDAKRQCV